LVKIGQKNRPILTDTRLCKPQPAQLHS